MSNLSQMTDEELAMQYVQGNNKAFDLLLSRNQSKLFSYILFVVHDQDVANDIFQETFVKVILNIQSGNYVPSGKFYAWITRIAHNMIMDQYRQQGLNNFIQEDPETGQVANNVELSDPSFEMQQVYDQSISDVVKLYKMLPDVQREIVFMRFYQDMSFKEIAEELGISINTALGRMRYAIINMKRIAAEKNISFEMR